MIIFFLYLDKLYLSYYNTIVKTYFTYHIFYVSRILCIKGKIFFKRGIKNIGELMERRRRTMSSELNKRRFQRSKE